MEVRQHARDRRLGQSRLVVEQGLDERRPIDRAAQRLEQDRVIFPGRRLAGLRVGIGLVEGDLLVGQLRLTVRDQGAEV